MNLNVLSIPQIYAYLMGWWQYDVWWAAMRDTGLFYIPIAVIFARAVIEPFLSQETRSGAVTAVKRMVTDLIYLLLFIAVFAVPSVYVSLASVRYQSTQGDMATYNHNDSTYAQHIPDSLKAQNEVAMPLGWYLFLNLANGLTGMAFNSLSDNQAPIRQAQQTFASMGIDDVDLRQEYRRFMNECYRPAHARYANGNYDSTLQPGIDQLNQQYGKVELNFAGSSILMKYFYPGFRAENPVPGFPFQANRDKMLAQQDPPPRWGRPYCDDWWPHLRARLLSSIRSQWEKQQVSNLNNPVPWNEMMSRMRSWLPWSDVSSSDVENAFLYFYLTELNPHRAQSALLGQSQAQQYYSEQYALKHAGDKGGETMSLLLTNLNGTITTLVDMLPLIQMMLLVATFALLPLGLILSFFRFRFILSAFAFVFVLVNMTYLWHLVSYIDNFFIESLYVSPDTGGGKFAQLLTGTGNLLSDKAVNTNVIMVNLVALIMYVVFPSILAGIFTWAGYSAGSALDGALSISQKESNRGAEAGETIKSRLVKKF